MNEINVNERKERKKEKKQFIAEKKRVWERNRVVQVQWTLERKKEREREREKATDTEINKENIREMLLPYMVTQKHHQHHSRIWKCLCLSIAAIWRDWRTNPERVLVDLNITITTCSCYYCVVVVIEYMLYVCVCVCVCVLIYRELH